VADPLPAVRSFFPHAETRSRLRRQSLKIDRLLHRNHIAHHNIVAAHGRSEIVKCYLADVQVFDQGYFTRPVARSIRMNRLKALSYFLASTAFQFFALMSSQICFSIFSPSLVVWFIVHRYQRAVVPVKLQTYRLPNANEIRGLIPLIKR